VAWSNYTLASRVRFCFATFFLDNILPRGNQIRYKRSRMCKLIFSAKNMWRCWPFTPSVHLLECMVHYPHCWNWNRSLLRLSDYVAWVDVSCFSQSCLSEVTRCYPHRESTSIERFALASCSMDGIIEGLFLANSMVFCRRYSCNETPSARPTLNVSCASWGAILRHDKAIKERVSRLMRAIIRFPAPSKTCLA
jgi:hypothetical protein